MPTLLSWLDQPATDRGIRFAQPDGTWEWWSYADLARLAWRSAWALRAAGVRRHDGVAVVEHTGPHFVGVLFGALLAGAVASPVAPPPRFRDREAYRRHVDGLLEAARPALVVAAPDVVDVVGARATAAGTPVVSTASLLDGVSAPDGPPGVAPADLALLQFTSGTTGRVRGVRIPYATLEANIGAIRRWLGMGVDDPTASWLPVHHDMGLVGCLLAPIVTGSDVWLMSPEEFVRRPLRYLACFGREGARLTAMPGFGLDHLVRRVLPTDLEGMDFTRWRAVILGAERLAPAALARFHALCAPRGLSRRALLPAYGLAEATLAVTGLPLAEDWAVTNRPDADVGRATSEPEPGVVGCGRALDGVRVSIVDDMGRPAPDGRVGEIIVGGAGVAAGYAGTDIASRFQPDGVHTGDAGFLVNGQLYVLGRLGDGIKIRGRAVFPEDLEALAAARLGVPPARLTCLLGVAGDTHTAVLVAERVGRDLLDRAPALLRTLVGDARVVVLDAPLGTVPRTSSGKPRRRELWRAFLAGELDRHAPPASRSTIATATTS